MIRIYARGGVQRGVTLLLKKEIRGGGGCVVCFLRVERGTLDPPQLHHKSSPLAADN